MAERFHVNCELGVGPVELDGPEAHHLATVCRLRPGDAVCLFNGDGHEYPAIIETVARRVVHLRILGVESPRRELPFHLEVAAPLPKGDRAQVLIEKLTELNIQAARASIDEATEVFKTLLETKDAKALVELASTGAQPAAEKFAAYAKQAYDIAATTNTELAKLVEKQVAESNKQLYAAIDAIAKNAPAGSEGAVALVKQAVNTANSAFDQVSKATKQVVEIAEANIAAAAKSSPVRAAAKKAA